MDKLSWTAILGLMVASVFITLFEGTIIAAVWNMFFASTGLVLTTGQGIALTILFMVLAYRPSESKDDSNFSPNTLAVISQLARLGIAVFALLLASAYHFLLP